MPAKLKVLELLSRADLDRLEAWARERERTVDQVFDWLLAEGFKLGRGAAWNWKKAFDATEKFAASNDVARTLVDAARAGGTVSVSDAATLQLSTMIFEKMLEAQQSGEVETKDLIMLSASLKNTITGKRHVEKLRADMAEALATAEREAKTGASGEAVISKVRQILGIKQA